MAHIPHDARHAATSLGKLVDRHHRSISPIVHPQHVLQSIERERPAVGRMNTWIADHIVGLAGTMAFFYALFVLILGWAAWQSGLDRDHGFDPFPYAFLLFILGGIMQSLFVPTMLVTSNRATARERIKDEADHRAWTHLYEVNEEQLRILRALSNELLSNPPEPASGADAASE